MNKNQTLFDLLDKTPGLISEANSALTSRNQQTVDECTAKLEDLLEQLMYQAQAARKLSKDQKRARSEAIRNAARARKSKDPAQMRASIAELQSLIASFGADVEYDQNAPQDADFEEMDDE